MVIRKVCRPPSAGAARGRRRPSARPAVGSKATGHRRRCTSRVMRGGLPSSASMSMSTGLLPKWRSATTAGHRRWSADHGERGSARARRAALEFREARRRHAPARSAPAPVAPDLGGRHARLLDRHFAQFEVRTAAGAVRQFRQAFEIRQRRRPTDRIGHAAQRHRVVGAPSASSGR